MLTEELNSNKMCLFCASDYHLEMILLPYIKERINNLEFVIFTQNNLDKTIKVLLDKVNIDESFKEKIKKLNWKNNDEEKFENIEEAVSEKKEINIIINGDYEYIKNINNSLKEIINKKINIIDCFHVGDINVDIEELSKHYKCILNTKKI